MARLRPDAHLVPATGGEPPGRRRACAAGSPAFAMGTTSGATRVALRVPRRNGWRAVDSTDPRPTGNPWHLDSRPAPFGLESQRPADVRKLRVADGPRAAAQAARSRPVRAGHGGL